MRSRSLPRSRSSAWALDAPAKHNAPPNTAVAKTALPNMDFKTLVNIASSRASRRWSLVAPYVLSNTLGLQMLLRRTNGKQGLVCDAAIKKERSKFCRAPGGLERISDRVGGRGRDRPNRDRCATCDRLHSTSGDRVPSTIRGRFSVSRAALRLGDSPSHAFQRLCEVHGQCGPLSSGNLPHRHGRAAHQEEVRSQPAWRLPAVFFSTTKIPFYMPSAFIPPFRKETTSG